MTSYPFTLPKLPSEKVNWKAVILWGVILGLIVFGVYHRESITAFLAKPTLDLSWLQNLTLDKIVAFIKDYSVLFSIGAAAFTFLYGMYQKHQANKATLELLKTQQTANTELNTAYDVAEKYRQQAETYKTQYEQASQSGTQTALNEALAEKSKLQKKYDELQTRYSEANHLLEVIQKPTNDVMKRALEKEGYIVTKRVD